MADKYLNFADLAAHVPTGSYRITQAKPAGAMVAHIAIHGGAIEPGTTQLAAHAATSGTHSFYSFEGILSSGNQDLHLTSTHFDEPTALSLVGGVGYTISWHGSQDPLTGAKAQTYLGGLDTALYTEIGNRLTAAGFTVAPADSTPPEKNADDPANITNKNSRGMGAQLEITRSQRALFFEDGDLDRSWIENSCHWTPLFYQYANAVNSALLFP
jgi:phage replication-related protein YjqB (UPF0714/DUF867 family)